MKTSSFYFLLITALTLFGATSCNSQTKTVAKKNNSKSVSAVKFFDGKDYMVFKRARVFDKVGFAQPAEAFSFLIPEKWKYSGEVLWTPPGSNCSGTNSRFKANSPDGKYSFELYPAFIWGFATDPQLAQFSQNMRSQYCSYGEPLDAEHYLKQMFIAKELGNPQIAEIKINHSGAQEMRNKAEKYRRELPNYGASQVNMYPSAVSAKVKWNDGGEGIVMCGVIITETIVPNAYNGTYSKIYTSTATERILLKYPPGERKNAENILSVIMSSMRTNSAWKASVDDYWVATRQQNYRVHIGNIKANDELTRQMGETAISKGQQNLNDMDNSMRSWEASQQSQDRMHTNFVKAIREVENYQDETGKVELSSGYSHAWSRSDGSSFIMSDNPNFDPSSVFQDQRWKEMKQVD